MKILFAQGYLLRKKEFQVQTIIYQEKNNYFVKKRGGCQRCISSSKKNFAELLPFKKD